MFKKIGVVCLTTASLYQHVASARVSDGRKQKHGKFKSSVLAPLFTAFLAAAGPEVVGANQELLFENLDINANFNIFLGKKDLMLQLADDPTPSPQETALKDAINKERKDVLNIIPMLQTFQQDVTDLVTKYKIELGMLVGFLSNDDRKAILQKLLIWDPKHNLYPDITGAINLIIVEGNKLPFYEKDAVKGALSALTSLNQKVSDIEQGVKNVAINEPQAIQNDFQEYWAKDHSPASLFNLVDTAEQAATKTIMNADGLVSNTVGTFKALAAFLEDSIKQKKFEEEDWERFISDEKAIIGQEQNIVTDSAAFENDVLAVQEKVKDLLFSIPELMALKKPEKVKDLLSMLSLKDEFENVEDIESMDNIGLKENMDVGADDVKIFDKSLKNRLMNV